eukprot:COSAG01_NODE_27_length_36706_cov_155.674106_27_plen_197_part_00
MSVRSALMVPCLFIGVSFVSDELVSRWAEGTSEGLAAPRRQLRGGGGHHSDSGPPAPPPPHACTEGDDTDYHGNFTGNSRGIYVNGDDCSLVHEYHCDRIVNGSMVAGECASPDGDGGLDCWVCSNMVETLDCVDQDADCLDDDDGAIGAILAVFFHIVFPLCISIPACIGTIYFRNKSMGTVSCCRGWLLLEWSC